MAISTHLHNAVWFCPLIFFSFSPFCIAYPFTTSFFGFKHMSLVKLNASQNHFFLCTVKVYRIKWILSFKKIFWPYSRPCSTRSLPIPTVHICRVRVFFYSDSFPVNCTLWVWGSFVPFSFSIESLWFIFHEGSEPCSSFCMLVLQSSTELFVA